MPRGQLRSRHKRSIIVVISAAVFAATTALLTFFGYLAIFSQFPIFDDEGFFLVALRSFIAGQPLYDKVVLQYGPFYFELFRLLAAFGVPMDLDSGSLMTLTLWSAMMLLIGVSVFVFTRNLFLAAATELVTFGISWSAFAGSSMHPSCLLMLLVIGIEAVVLFRAGRWTGRWPLILIGALAAAAVLTKINVGGFAVVAIAFACVLAIPAFSRNPLLRLIAAVVVVALPFALMRPYLDQAWAQRYAGEIGLGGLGLVVAVSTSTPEPGPRPMDILWLLAGGAALTIAVVTILILLGSTPSGLLHGVLLDPLRQSVEDLNPPPLRATALYWGLVGVAGATVWTLYRLYSRRPEPALEGTVRILVGLITWVAVIGSLPIPGVMQLDALSQRFVLPVVLAWVVVAPRSGPEGWARLDFVRVVLAAMAILQGLQAFPVAGAQVFFGGLSLVTVGAVSIHDGLMQLSWRPVTRELATACLFLLLAMSWVPPTWRQLTNGYSADVPLRLPGATLVRLPSDQAETLTAVTQFVRENCDTYISIPGLDSFYIFAPVPRPLRPRAGSG